MGDRVSSVEPFSGALVSVFRVFGVLLALCVVTPWMRLRGDSMFVWDLWSAPRVPFAFKMFVVFTALTAIATLALSYASRVPLTVKAAVGVVAGAVPAVFIFAKAMGQSAGFTGVAQMAGLFLMPAGFLLRSRYPDQHAGKLLATIGGAAVIIASFAPGALGKSAASHNWDMLTGDVPKFMQGWRWKMAALLTLAPIALGLISFMTWIRSEGSMAGRALAWACIVVVPCGLIMQGLAVRAAMPAHLAGPPLFVIAQGPVILAAWLALPAHGVAVLIGRQLEPMTPQDAASVF